MTFVTTMPRELTRLKNIGGATAEWLRDVGIFTEADLRAVGAVQAYKILKAAYPQGVTILALYALEGALLDIHWNAIPPERKAELKKLAESS